MKYILWHFGSPNIKIVDWFVKIILETNSLTCPHWISGPSPVFHRWWGIFQQSRSMFGGLFCSLEELHHEPWCEHWEAIEENRGQRNWGTLWEASMKHRMNGNMRGCNLQKQQWGTSLETARRETHLSWTTTHSATIGLWVIGLTRYNVPLRKFEAFLSKQG